MKKLPFALVASLVLGSVYSARAAEPAPEPSWADLPVTAVAQPPEKAPPRIAARERVEGLVVRSAGGGGEYAMVDARTQGENGRNVDLCISAPEDGRQQAMFGGPKERATRWDDGGQPTVHFPRTQGPSAFRAERFDDKAGQPIVTAWTFFADPVTLGARLVEKREIAVKLVRETSFGVKIYAARDDRSVHVYIVNPADMADVTGFQLTSERSSGLTTHSNGCRLGHLSLAAEKGHGEMTSARATVVPGMEPEKAPVGEDGQPQQMAPGQELVRARLRTVAYHLSTTFLSGDAQPVFSVSYGWDGRERSVVTVRQTTQPAAFALKRFRK